jgi:hypothetical protein
MGFAVEATVTEEIVAARHVEISKRRDKTMDGRVMVAPHQYVRL